MSEIEVTPGKFYINHKGNLIYVLHKNNEKFVSLLVGPALISFERLLRDKPFEGLRFWWFDKNEASQLFPAQVTDSMVRKFMNYLRGCEEFIKRVQLYEESNKSSFSHVVVDCDHNAWDLLFKLILSTDCDCLRSYQRHSYFPYVVSFSSELEAKIFKTKARLIPGVCEAKMVEFHDSGERRCGFERNPQNDN